MAGFTVPILPSLLFPSLGIPAKAIIVYDIQGEKSLLKLLVRAQQQKKILWVKLVNKIIYWAQDATALCMMNYEHCSIATNHDFTGTPPLGANARAQQPFFGGACVLPWQLLTTLRHKQEVHLHLATYEHLEAKQHPHFMSNAALGGQPV